MTHLGQPRPEDGVSMGHMRDYLASVILVEGSILSHFFWTLRHRTALKRNDFLGWGCRACPGQPALVFYCWKIDTTLCVVDTPGQQVNRRCTRCKHSFTLELEVKRSLSRPTRMVIARHGVERTRVSLI